MAINTTNSFSFDPFPVLETNRLVLRAMTPADASDYYQLRSNPRVMQYLDRPLATSIEDMQKMITDVEKGIQEKTLINWGICLKGQSQIIGTIGYYKIMPAHFRAEIGYLLDDAFHRRGLMSEALGAVLKFGFEHMHLHSIEAQLNPHNEASIGILHKFRFTKEAHFKQNYFFQGKFLDTAVYSLIKPN